MEYPAAGMGRFQCQGKLTIVAIEAHPQIHQIFDTG
jgi:hypothetical protein